MIDENILDYDEYLNIMNTGLVEKINSKPKIGKYRLI